MKKLLKCMLYGFFYALAACSATKEYTLVTLEPATVNLQPNIKRIGIINESLVQEKKAYANRLDQILAEKDIQLDKQGKDAAISGLFDELWKDNRFDTIKIIENVPSKLKSLGDTEENISWTTIESLCKDNKVDAIFSLSHYDTDTQISMRKKKIMQANMLRVKEKVKGNEVTLETLIKNGWRIYNPQKKQVIDEFVFSEAFTSKAEGVGPVQALIAIEDRATKVMTQSKNKGEAYGMRLLPNYSGLNRKYFIKGSKELSLAHEYIENGDWDTAITIWESLRENKNKKLQSRAVYNLAFYEEIKGNLGGALFLANKAHKKHPNKTYLQYVNALKERIKDTETVKQQLAKTYFQVSL